MSTNEDTAKTITLAGTDPDSNPLSYKVTSLAGHGELYDGTGTSGHHIVSGDLPYTVVDSTHKVTYDPASNYNGGDSFNFKVNDGTVDSAAAAVSITVDAVNDEPSFSSGGNVTVNEDSGAYSAVWATAISKGPANESGQTLTFHVSNDNNSLFSAQPNVDETTGNLTFTPAANANGSATVSVYLTDSGSNVAPNDNTSPTQTFTLTVTAVNDEPSFSSGGNVTVNEDSGAYSAVWATAISRGRRTSRGRR